MICALFFVLILAVIPVDGCLALTAVGPDLLCVTQSVAPSVGRYTILTSSDTLTVEIIMFKSRILLAIIRSTKQPLLLRNSNRTERLQTP